MKPDRYFVNAEGGTVNLGAQKLALKRYVFVVKENGKPIEVNKKLTVAALRYVFPLTERL